MNKRFEIQNVKFNKLENLGFGYIFKYSVYKEKNKNNCSIRSIGSIFSIFFLKYIFASKEKYVEI